MAAPPVPSRPLRIPYDPHRISRPGSILEPITQAERRVFANPTNSLRTALAARSSARPKVDGGYSPSRSYSPSNYDQQRKRKRTASDDDEQASTLQKRQKERDQNVVAKHYDDRPEVGRSARKESPIYGLKSFNNWIKSVLMQKMAYPALTQSRSRRTLRANLTLAGRVLDIGCGKGGDLQKWRSARIKEYVGVDIAGVSVSQARERWRDWRGDKAERFDATFAQLDCYRHPLDAELPPKVFSEPFDVVTMQFCMHYAFETEAKVRMMLDNVTSYLRPGGRFIGTVPNSDILLNSLAEAQESDPNALSFGNEVYRIRFDQARGPLYGHRYMFFLEDAVEDVPEYVVYWEEFVSLASQYGLALLYKREFHEVYAEEAENPEFNALLKRMKVVDDDNNSAMDPAQWDAANVYLAFAFEKR
ncbi:related to RNA (guanine-N7-) methyltransferase [Serendipita indica DSM 11827]|uniref:mRNA cap guanine-N(7) methyltransferase n=1 Tax=Serendipita indica (strain DSM 11827) TaxID=1109443 RepID=G4TEV4_SERID|nr:related to RNA (guanine-N7-) methyltransferase [Serendipita indica DSM 11827]